MRELFRHLILVQKRFCGGNGIFAFERVADNSGNGHWVVGVLCAKLKLHKITPNTQGIRHYDVMISGEVQSLALPQIMEKIEHTKRCKAGV